jgi:hypothetical protein
MNKKFLQRGFQSSTLCLWTYRGPQVEDVLLSAIDNAWRGTSRVVSSVTPASDRFRYKSENAENVSAGFIYGFVPGVKAKSYRTGEQIEATAMPQSPTKLESKILFPNAIVKDS